MKKFIITTLFITLVAGGLLGRDGLRSHWKTVKELVGGTVRNSTPDQYERERIQTLITDKSREILAYRDRLDDMSARYEDEKASLEKLSKSITSDRATLASERELLLEKGQTTFVLHGRDYNRSQVESSAAARLVRYKGNLAKQETKEAVVAQLGSALENGEARLAEATAFRDKLKAELDLLVIRLDNARLQNEVAELAAPLQGGLTGDSELGKSMEAFEERIRVIERESRLKAPEQAQPGIISPNEPGTGDVLDEIGSLLGEEL